MGGRGPPPAPGALLGNFPYQSNNQMLGGVQGGPNPMLAAPGRSFGKFREMHARHQQFMRGGGQQ